MSSFRPGIGRRRWTLFVLHSIAATERGAGTSEALLAGVAAVYPHSKSDAAKQRLIARLIGEPSIRIALVAGGVELTLPSQSPQGA